MQYAIAYLIRQGCLEHVHCTWQAHMLKMSAFIQTLPLANRHTQKRAGQKSDVDCNCYVPLLKYTLLALHSIMLCVHVSGFIWDKIYLNQHWMI